MSWGLKYGVRWGLGVQTSVALGAVVFYVLYHVGPVASAFKDLVGAFNTLMATLIVGKSYGLLT